MEEEPRKRVVIVPLAAQGHVTPMMQLAKSLHLKGFSISVAQMELDNPLIPSHAFPEFQFLTIPGLSTLSESEFKLLGLVELLMKLNEVFAVSFKEWLEEQGCDDVACVIYDEYMYFSEAAANEVQIPSVMFSSTNATSLLCRSVLGGHAADRFLATLTKPGADQEQMVAEFDPLRYKDLPTSAFAPLETSVKLYGKAAKIRTAVAVIINTVNCLESLSLSRMRQVFEAPVYPVGPLHMAVTAAPCSLLEEDRSCMDWLNKQKPSSVIYVSLGSLALMEKNEAVEMAWGLADSNQPFLWVVRPGSVPEDWEWRESLPEELRRQVSERGYVVKWAPQKEVLAHSAVGGFWSHCGWNSTLESIGEGVRMICRPFTGDQKVNARYLDSVWRIGIQVDGDLKRDEVARAVRRLMAEEEGEDMKKRAAEWKEKLRVSVSNGGSSCNSLDELADFIKTL